MLLVFIVIFISLTSIFYLYLCHHTFLTLNCERLRDHQWIYITHTRRKIYLVAIFSFNYLSLIQPSVHFESKQMRDLFSILMSGWCHGSLHIVDTFLNHTFFIYSLVILFLTYSRFYLSLVPLGLYVWINVRVFERVQLRFLLFPVRHDRNGLLFFSHSCTSRSTVQLWRRSDLNAESSFYPTCCYSLLVFVHLFHCFLDVDYLSGTR